MTFVSVAIILTGTLFIVSAVDNLTLADTIRKYGLGQSVSSGTVSPQQPSGGGGTITIPPVFV